MDTLTNSSAIQNSTNGSSSFGGAPMEAEPTAYFGIISALGTVAAVENIGILLVLCSTRQLFETSSLLIGLTIAHVLNGLVHAVEFWPRPTAVAITTKSLSSLDCLLKFYPNVFNILYFLLPLFLTLVALERCLAVATPLWYRVHCTLRRLWLVTAVGYGLAFLGFMVNFLIAWLVPSSLITERCLPTEIFGQRFMVFGVYMPAIVGGVGATVLTVVGIHAGYRRISALKKMNLTELERTKRQLRLAKCVLTISCIDLVCVVVPNIVLALYDAGAIPTLANQYRSYCNIAYVLDSALNILPYCLFNAEFRQACRKLVPRFHRCRFGNATSTTTMVEMIPEFSMHGERGRRGTRDSY